MTPAAVVLPDAAVRMPRAVAGRRVLQVVLLLAGLLALGFLCGERAHAADGVPAPGQATKAAARSVEPVRVRVAEPAREAVRGGGEAVRDAAVEPVADVAEPVARTARGVVRPVVDGVTGVVEGAPQRVLPEASDLPGTPSLPAADVPELPQPGPGHGAGAGAGAEPPASRAGQGEVTARAHGARAESSYGTGSGTGTGTRTSTHLGTGSTLPSGQQAHRTGHEPSPPPPPLPSSFPSAPGDPARTLGGQSAGDGSSTRQGDPCTASLDGRAPVRLLQGAGAGQVPAPIRERHRDIPEFPG
ncbi:hypothetical protein OG302_17635 [Streptomyces sp. NBC_01283]|uniref:hypothetical protein n=1 Tax=Streptomyces sp. NBC_01283 TaxID=2903812 RepID=UPI00352FAD05|nr:hypothetical protein OG302_17635 [Streptomyces sp. NBC_01283]